MITSLYLMPTQRCNCTCDYCYIPNSEKNKQGDAGFFSSVVGRFVRKAQWSGLDSGEFQLRFTGGEPYMEAELMRQLILEFLDGLPAGMAVINTNGTLVKEQDLTDLHESRDNIHHVVSLDGPEQIHNKRRHMKNGGNAYDETLSGIRALQESGFPVYINMVLDDDSIVGLEELMRFAKNSLGLDTLSVSLLDSPEHPMTVPEKFDLLSSAYEKAERSGIMLTGHHRLLLGCTIPGLRCRAGEKTVLISSDGKLNICQRFVGKDAGAPEYGEDYEFTGGDSSSTDCCYTDDVRRLADEICKLYERKYPQYSAVHEVDRILFGTI